MHLCNLAVNNRGSAVTQRQKPRVMSHLLCKVHLCTNNTFQRKLEGRHRSATNCFIAWTLLIIKISSSSALITAQHLVVQKSCLRVLDQPCGPQAADVECAHSAGSAHVMTACKTQTATQCNGGCFEAGVGCLADWQLGVNATLRACDEMSQWQHEAA